VNTLEKCVSAAAQNYATTFWNPSNFQYLILDRSTLEINSLECTQMNAYFTACLWEGLIHRYIASPNSPPYVCQQITHGSAPHTTTLVYCMECSTNNKF